MASEPLIVEQVYQAPIGKVWSALTNYDQTKQWYFDIPDFKPEPGCEFSFTGGSKEKTYTHRCKVKEVTPNKKLSYTWTYDGIDGYSEVSFELFPDGPSTRLKLTHTGLDSFPQDNKDFARSSFEAGWTMITGTMLKNFVEK